MSQTMWLHIGKFNLLVDSSSELSAVYQKYPLYSSQVGRLASAVLQKYPDLCMLDIGANVGDTVAVVKNLVDIPVVCVEGEEHCFDLLEQNIRQFDGVQAHRQYLGEKTERIRAVLEKESWNATIIPQEEEDSIDVRLMSLDDFIGQYHLVAHFKLAKIDTEGFDTRIIRGARSYLQTTRPILFFEYNRQNMNRIGEDGLSTLRWLQELNYQDVLFYDWKGRFVVSATFENWILLRQLHDYVDGRSSSFGYFDICAFHLEDHDLAKSFIAGEEAFRLTQ